MKSWLYCVHKNNEILYWWQSHTSQLLFAVLPIHLQSNTHDSNVSGDTTSWEILNSDNSSAANDNAWNGSLEMQSLFSLTTVRRAMKEIFSSLAMQSDHLVHLPKQQLAMTFAENINKVIFAQLVTHRFWDIPKVCSWKICGNEGERVTRRA